MAYEFYFLSVGLQKLTWFGCVLTANQFKSLFYQFSMLLFMNSAELIYILNSGLRIFSLRNVTESDSSNKARTSCLHSF